MYSDGGYLAKTITRIVPGRQIDFDITEQTIRYHRRIILKGGTIAIEAHEDGTSSVHMLTRYKLRFPTLGLGRFFVELVMTAMHSIVIRDMQQALACRDDEGHVSDSRLSLPQAAAAMPDRTRSANPSACVRTCR
jgi:hypothetical protein